MPVVFTFDISGAPNTDYNQIQSFFERFGWQNLGGTAWRYPRLGAELDHPVEDWFNHVIPALMLFRCYAVDGEGVLTRFTLDVHSSAGMNPETEFGTPPLASEQINLYQPNNVQFGESNLLDWLDEVQYPYRRCE